VPSLTFANLQTKVLGWLDESEDNTVVLANIKEALAQANTQRAVQHEWPFMLVSPTTLSLVVGQTDYTLASDFHIPRYFYNTTLGRPLHQRQRRHLPLDSAPWRTSAIEGDFELHGNTLSLLYKPTSTDTIEYQYFRQPAELSADNDVPDLPYPHSRILIYDALLELALYSEDITPEKIALWQKRQMEMEANLYAAYLDGNTRGSDGNFILDTSDD
jgi:hypothetical protein